jgi:DNA-directed RNA polymerase subunit H (RpoH/RPB5)
LKEVDILKHELVPKHMILNEKEKEDLFKKYGITIRQLPRMVGSDPVIKVLNGQPGDVVKIVRKSPTARESVYYRVVVKG